MPITTVGLDADDTLWHNETIFRMTQARFRELMADHAEPEFLDARLAEVERRNLALYGYGVKGFTLSLIETAMDITGGEGRGRADADMGFSRHRRRQQQDDGERAAFRRSGDHLSALSN